MTTKRRQRGLKPDCEKKIKGLAAASGGPLSSGLVFGLDEVGRGCLAGPVYAACAVYPLGAEWPKLPRELIVTDSKKLSYAQRKVAEVYLDACGLVQVFVAEATVEEIDSLNILHASGLAMHRAFEAAWQAMCVDQAPGEYHVLVDGNYVPRAFRGGPHEPRVRTIIKGDAHSFAIAAAAIVAKNRRDEFMWELARSYPGYGWESNVGYSSPSHKDGLRSQGFSDWHRRSFNVQLDALDAVEDFAPLED